MNQKYLISLLLIFCLFIYAMSGDGGNEPKIMKTIAELEGFGIDNMWPDQNNYIDSIEYEDLKREYFKKGKNLGIINDGVIRSEYWDHRINLNKLRELRKLGADTVSTKYLYMTMLDHAMIAHSVIIGTIKDMKFSSGPLKTTYTVSVDEVLTGNDLYVNFPDSVYIKYDIKLDNPNIIIFDSGTQYHKLGNQYMFYLQRNGLEHYAKNIDYYIKGSQRAGEELDSKKLVKEINQPYTFISWASFNITDLQSYKTVYERQDKKVFDFEKIKEKIRKIGILNDKANFFKRNY